MDDVSIDSLRCRDCWDPITLSQYRRKSQLCDDCEFDRLTPPGWWGDFLRRLEARKVHVGLADNDDHPGHY